MKTVNGQRQKFLDMQECPANYSDEQIEAMMDSIDAMPDVEKEWAEFNKAYLTERSNSKHAWKQQIAAAVACLVIVGAVYAAAIGIVPNVFSMGSKESKDNVQMAATESVRSEAECADDEKNAVFDNVPLEEILSRFSDYYNINVIYINDKTKSVRLYFNWNKSASLDENVSMLNAFDKIKIRIDDDALTVE